MAREYEILEDGAGTLALRVKEDGETVCGFVYGEYARGRSPARRVSEDMVSFVAGDAEIEDCFDEEQTRFAAEFDGELIAWTSDDYCRDHDKWFECDYDCAGCEGRDCIYYLLGIDESVTGETLVSLFVDGENRSREIVVKTGGVATYDEAADIATEWIRRRICGGRRTRIQVNFVETIDWYIAFDISDEAEVITARREDGEWRDISRVSTLIFNRCGASAREGRTQ